MPQFDLLQPRREALQEHYGLLSKKLMALRHDAAIATDPGIKFQLNDQIATTEKELEELGQQQDELERSCQDGRLYQALLKLGYRKQVQLFRKFVEKNPVAAFLIYGKLDYGQRWLLNRLVVQHIKDNITAKSVRINLGRISRRSDVTALWRELGGRVGLGPKGTPSAIVERIYQWWQTQNVLLIFYEVDVLPEPFLEELLREFWLPLATQAWEIAQPESAYKLLMFLVDDDGCVGDWSIPFVESLETAWHPRMPVKLPLISEFTTSELANWLEFSADDLPVDFMNDSEEVAQDILDNSDNGIPKPTLEEICYRAGLDWYENEDKWMKL